MNKMIKFALSRSPPIVILHNLHILATSTHPSGEFKYIRIFKFSGYRPKVIVRDFDMKDCVAPVSNKTRAKECEIRIIPSTTVFPACAPELPPIMA